MKQTVAVSIAIATCLCARVVLAQDFDTNPVFGSDKVELK